DDQAGLQAQATNVEQDRACRGGFSRGPVPATARVSWLKPLPRQGGGRLPQFTLRCWGSRLLKPLLISTCWALPICSRSPNGPTSTRCQEIGRASCRARV